MSRVMWGGGVLAALLIVLTAAPAWANDAKTGAPPPMPRLDGTWTTPPDSATAYPSAWRRLTYVSGGEEKRRNCCKDPCGGCWTVEGRRMARKPDKWTWITSAAILGGGAALFASDDIDAIEQVGDWTQIAVPVVAGGMAGFKRDWEGAKQFGLSIGSSIVTVTALKEGVGRWRPNESNNKSWPSGHTMAAFSGASYIYTRYGAKWGIPAYLAAMYVGASRIKAEKHFADDVLSGASIAMMFNWLFVKPCGMKCRPPQKLCCRKARYLFEFGGVDFQENKVTNPRGSGSTIDFADFQNSNRPAIAARAGVQVFRGRQDWLIQLSPNEYRDTGTTTQPYTFGNSTIPAGTDIFVRNLIHDYRLRWRYNLTPRGCFRVRVGAALALQDSTVEILDNNTGVRFDRVHDTIFLPVAHLHVGWQFARDFLLYAQADAGWREDYRSLESSLFCRWQIDEYWDVGLGVRWSDGIIEAGQYENTWQASSLVLQFGRSFYGGGSH